MAHEDVDEEHGGQHEVQDEHAAVAGHALGTPGQWVAAACAERVEAQALHHGEDHVDLHDEAKPEWKLAEKGCRTGGTRMKHDKHDAFGAV